MKKLASAFLGFSILFLCSNQTATAQSISGVINDYTAVNAIDSCNVTVTSVTDFSVGDKVMIIQMKGADIDTSDTPSFGEILDYEDCGNYEWNRIAAITGSVISLEFLPEKTYTMAGLVQLIRVPEYTNATIDGELSCQPWDGTTGGVVAFIDDGTTTFNADINVDFLGFRGTTFQPTGWVSCAATYKEDETTIESEKGEGIYILPTSMTRGLGANGNGGGGGKTDNGGGGASNFGAGGLGGNFGWTASCNIEAQGGWALTYNNTENKIFLGGAGGDAQNSEGPGTNFGEDGGAIVIIRSDEIVGNGFNITAQGEDAFDTPQDGGGGGGAGGTVLLDCPLYTTTLNVNTSGGDGGDANIYTPVGCSGGGGGGGGVLWVSTPTVDPNITYVTDGGVGGLSMSTVDGSPGDPGGTVTDLEIPESIESCATTPPDEVTVVVTDATCPGAEDGAITISVTGADPPYTFEWSTGDSGPTVTGLAAGTYTVDYTNASGDVVTVTVVVGESDAVGIGVVAQSNPTCFGFTDGSVTVEALGGTPEYTWSWTPANTVPGSAANNNLGAGTYWVNVVDANGCIDSLMITLQQPDPIDVDLDITHVQCHGDASGIVVVDTVLNWQGGYGNMVFIWDPDPQGVSGIGADSLWGLPAGDSYNVTVNDENGCSAVISYEIEEPEPLEFAEIGYQPAFCRLYGYQVGNGQVFAAATGGTADYTYLWTQLGTTPPVTNVSSTWGGLNPGDYEMVVTDLNGCTLAQVVTLDSVNPTAVLDVASTDLNGNLEGNAVVCIELQNNSLYFANEFDPLADTSFWLSMDYPTDPWQLYKDSDYFLTFDTCYTEGGLYDVCLKIQNKNGCEDSTCHTITVWDPLDITPPNVFTPNGDGVNDVYTFEYLSKGVKTFSCIIVDRWGVTMAQLDGITDGWDGTDRNGSICRDGVYFFTYEGEAEDGEAFAGQGTIQIIGTEKK